GGARAAPQAADAPLALPRGLAANVLGVGGRHALECRHKVERDADVPADQHAGGELPVTRERCDDDEADDGGQEQPRTGADNAHCTRQWPAMLMRRFAHGPIPTVMVDDLKQPGTARCLPPRAAVTPQDCLRSSMCSGRLTVTFRSRTRPFASE